MLSVLDWYDDLKRKTKQNLFKDGEDKLLKSLSAGHNP